MTSRDFAFWLQGFFEVSNATSITSEQLIIIKNHLNLVFRHDIDPYMVDENHQQELNNTHGDLTLVEEAMIVSIYGPKPSPQHLYNPMYGWYHPSEERSRC